MASTTTTTTTTTTRRLLSSMPRPRRMALILLLLLLSLLIHHVHAAGDFDELNALLQNAVIRLPDTVVERDLSTLEIYNAQCTGVTVEDIIVSHSTSGDITYIQLEILGLGLTCTCNVHYEALLGIFLQGRGTAHLESTNNDAFTTVRVSQQQQQQDEWPPSISATVQECNTNIQIQTIDLNGDSFLFDLLDSIEPLLISVMERQASTAICDYLSDGGAAQEAVDLFQELLQPYSPHTPPTNHDPLGPEQDLLESTTTPLLDWTSDKTQWMHFLLDKAVEYLGSSPTNSTSTPDLVVNQVLRDTLLTDDGALVLEGNLFENAPIIIYQGHDALTQTTIYLEGLRLRGLDSLIKFEPLVVIGTHTLQTQLSWEYLAFEIDLKIDMRPSTREDSVIVNNPTTTSSVVEHVTIQLGVNDVHAALSLLLAMDEQMLGLLQLGKLLDTDTILSCLLSSVVGDLEITSLQVSIGDVPLPTVTGFVSAGADRVLRAAVHAAFAVYKETLLQATPGFFQTTLREMWNDNILNRYPRECSNVPAQQQPDTNVVDLRDLLLDPVAARSVGGSGQEPYGNVVHRLVGLLQEQLVALNSDGLPKVNTVLQSLTRAQSGVDGMLQFSGDLFHFVQTDILDTTYWSSLLERIEITAHNVSVQHVDSLTLPLMVLNATKHQLVQNQINVGPLQHSLTGNVRLFVSLEGDNTALNMQNEVELSVVIPSLSLLLDVVAAVDQESLLEFPLQDVGDYYCWLATIPNVTEETLALSRFDLILSDLFLNVTCVSCTSPGGAMLPQVIQVLHQVGATNVLKERLTRHAKGVALRFWRQLEINHSEAPKLCRHGPMYDGDAVAREGNWWSQVIRLSRDSVETLVLVGALALDATLVVVAKSHLLLPATLTDPLSAQSSLTVPQDARLIDWTDLAGTVGSWAESALDKARAYIGTTSHDAENHDGANELIQSIMLDDDGMFVMDFENVTWNASGVALGLKAVRIGGLDTVSRADVVVPIGPQTIQNEIALERLKLWVDIAIQTTEPDETEPLPSKNETMTLSFGIRDVAVNLAVLLAMDLNQLGDLKLGAFLDMKNALPCVLSTAVDAAVPQLAVSIGSFDSPALRGWLSPDLQVVAADLMNALFDEFRGDLVAAVPKVFDTTVRDTMNDVVRLYRQENACITSIPGRKGSDVVDFRDLFLPESMSRDFGGSGESPYGDLFRTLHDAINQFLNVSSEETSINDLLQSWTLSQSNVSGTLEYAGDLVNTTANLSLAGLDARMAFKVSDVLVENLDSFGDIQLLSPISGEASVLDNSAALGVGSKPLRFSGRLVISIDGSAGVQIRNEVDAFLELFDIDMFVRVLWKISESALTNFPMRDVTNIACWLAAVPSQQPTSEDRRSAALIRHAVSVNASAFNVTCVDCSSPDFDSLITKLYAPALGAGLEQADRFLRSDFLQAVIDRFFHEASRRCPHSPEYDPDAAITGDFFTNDSDDGNILFPEEGRDPKVVYFHVANAILLVILIATIVIVKLVVRRRRRSWLKSLSTEETFHLHRFEGKEQEREAELNDTTKSLFCSPHIPRHVRLVTPVALLGTIGLHLGAHFGVLSTVNVEARIAGQDLSVDQFLSFSFLEATLDTYRNGGNEMAIFMFVFNGIWPYIKLTTLLVLWFLPPNKLSVSRRGKVLLWIDVLVRLSIVDMFTMIVAIAAILVFIGGPDESLVGDVEYFAMKAIVLLQGGFYALMIGQRLSRAASRFVLDHHNRIVELASRAYDEAHDVKRRNTSVCTDDDSLPVIAAVALSVNTDVHDAESPAPSPARSPIKDLDDEGTESKAEDETDGNSLDTSTSMQESHEDEESQDSCLSSSSMNVTNGAKESPDEPCVEEVQQDDCHSLNGEKKHSGEPPMDVADRNECLSIDGPTSGNETVVEDANRQHQGGYCCFTRPLQGGTIGVIFAGVTAFCLLIVGIVFAPAISFDTKSIWAMVIESGKSFQEAVQDYSVFRFIATVLLQSRFVLQGAQDYVGLGVLIALGIVAGVLFPLMQVGSFLRRKFKKKKETTTTIEREDLPTYMRSFTAYQDMEVHVVAFVIACWQFSAIALYAIHYFCVLLERIYDTLVYLGVFLQDTQGTQCFRTQASLPSTILILVLGFMVLLASFFIQLAAQYRRNMARATKLTEDDVWI